MERSRVTLITLICVLLSRISGAEVEMRVRPGDDITLYSDCVWKRGFNAVWFRSSSNKHQPPLIISAEYLIQGAHPRYSFEFNQCNKTYNLVVKNVTESDLGLYFCARQETKIINDGTGVTHYEDVYHYGNRITRLSLLEPTPPVSDCSVCWKLLVSVCPVCVFLSSTCVYCICRYTTTGEKKHGEGEGEEKENQKSTKRNKKEFAQSQNGGQDVCYASLDLPSREEKRLKKERVESSDFRTYSEVKTGKI